MPLKRHDFRAASARALADEKVTEATRRTAQLFRTKRSESVTAYPGFEALRDWGRSRKLEISGRLKAYAKEFAERVEALGGHAYFARDAAEVARVVTRIAEARSARTAVKSKSMTAEEVGLNERLAEAGIEVTETDLGEYIIQLAGEKPSHIIAPAIHKDRRQVAELFGKVLGTSPEFDVEGLVRAARRVLRQRFLNADLGITGANFAIAETGTIVLITNEGNGRLTTSLPAAHVVIVGMDKMIPRLSDLPGFLTLLIRSATGQTVSSYITAVTGPRRPGEDEGPEELHVVLLDNGRSQLSGGPYREMLHCLHCGACLNHCPVYAAVGGHAYESVYPGPMGDVLSPLLWGMASYPDLPDACTLCGRCAEVCPMRIPLPEFHRRLRAVRERQSSGATTVSEVLAAAATCPVLYRSGLGVARTLLGPFAEPLRRAVAASPLEAWTSCRELPTPGACRTESDFRSWWQNRTGRSS